ncbi:MAG: endolytic transglycosylase MltG [Pusillimonas sp.]
MTSFLKKLVIGVVLLVVSGAGALVGGGWYWANAPVQIQGETARFPVESGTGLRAIARSMNTNGVTIQEDLFVTLARLLEFDTRIKAGTYEVKAGDSPLVLLERMASGDMLLTRMTLPEGWTYEQIRQALRTNPDVRQTLDGVTDQELMARLGIDSISPEGWFYPDTYVFAPGTPDIDILRQAYASQHTMLEALWAKRTPELPLKSPYEALILASIIEKETGHSKDRSRVSGVFINRLRIGMPLQTDPTVIYGMGDKYTGRIRKADLQTDTPWNTYTRGGLPPTPIASSGRAALEAALSPEQHKYLYFVARGDGTSEFSENLRQHNRAVAKYILGR